MQFNVNVTVDLGDKTMSLLGKFAAEANRSGCAPGQDNNLPVATSHRIAERTAAPAIGTGTGTVETPAVSDAQEAAPEPKSPVLPSPEPAKTEPEKPTRTRRTREQIEAEDAKTQDGWADLDDEAKLEAIRAKVTENTKKGRSADVKFMLANFDAGRAAELATTDYDAFYNAITRYGRGESVETIFSGDLD